MYVCAVFSCRIGSLLPVAAGDLARRWRKPVCKPMLANCARTQSLSCAKAGIASIANPHDDIRARASGPWARASSHRNRNLSRRVASAGVSGQRGRRRRPAGASFRKGTMSSVQRFSRSNKPGHERLYVARAALTRSRARHETGRRRSPPVAEKRSPKED